MLQTKDQRLNCYFHNSLLMIFNQGFFFYINNEFHSTVTISGEVISEKYTLEYGSDCLEMHVGAVKAHERALVVDDLIATGGTLRAAMNLLGELPLICYIN